MLLTTALMVMPMLAACSSNNTNSTHKPSGETSTGNNKEGDLPLAISLWSSHSMGITIGTPCQPGEKIRLRNG